jgi:hypothetical protein
MAHKATWTAEDSEHSANAAYQANNPDKPFKQPLVIPTVHLNGTSKTELVNGYRDALGAVNEAYRKLAAIMPHGRDYYVQSDGRALSIARNQHVDRLRKLEEIKTELETIAVAVVDQ